MAKIGQLKKFISTSEVAGAFFQNIKGRTKNYSITTVQRAVRLTGAERKEVVEMFKKLQDLGLGEFIVGRRNSPSRFAWTVGMVETAKDVFEKQDDTPIKPLPKAELEMLEEEPEDLEEEEEEEEGFTRHTFQLRKNLAVHFSLPSDLTPLEAKRLAILLTALPLAAE